VESLVLSLVDDAPSLPPPVRQALLVAVDVSGGMTHERRTIVIGALSSALDELKRQVVPGKIDLSVFAFTTDAHRLWPRRGDPSYRDITEFSTEFVRRLPETWQPGTSLFELLQRIKQSYVAHALDAGRPLTVMIFTDGLMDATPVVHDFLHGIRTMSPDQPVPGAPAWKQPKARVFGIAPDDNCRPGLCALFGDEYVHVVDSTDAWCLTRLLITATQNALVN
jgi:hypothetical protein